MSAVVLYYNAPPLSSVFAIFLDFHPPFIITKRTTFDGRPPRGENTYGEVMFSVSHEDRKTFRLTIYYHKTRALSIHYDKNFHKLSYYYILPFAGRVRGVMAAGGAFCGVRERTDATCSQKCLTFLPVPIILTEVREVAGSIPLFYY